MRFAASLVSLLVVTATTSCSSTSKAPAPADSRPPAEVVAAAERSSAESSDEQAAAPVAAAQEAAAPTAQEPQSSSELLQDTAQRQALMRARQEELSKQYIAQGDRLLDQADLQGALVQFSQALEVMPTSEVAKERIRKVESLMGNRYAGAAQGSKDLEEQEAVRRAQARIAAADAALQAKQALARGDYDTAATKYREALLILRYHPLIADDTLNEQVLQAQLDSTAQLAAEAAKAREAAQRTEAEAAAQKREKEQLEYRQQRLATLWDKANAAYRATRYSEAQAIASQILLEDPGNSAAIQLRDTAAAAKHGRIDEENELRYREEWQRTFDELDTMDVPQFDPLVFDVERWKKVSERKPLELSTGDAQEAQDKLAVLERLESVRFAPHFVGADGSGSPLTEIASFLQNLTGVNFLISPQVGELDEEATTIKLDLPERSVRKVLDLIAETSENIRWKIENGVVMFVTKEQMTGGQVMKMYGVQDLIHPVPNFPGRDINVTPSGGIEASDETVVAQEALVVTSDALEALIRDNISPASWNEDPKNSVRITEAGILVVSQTPEVQDQIRQLLDSLREATTIMVDIQARFLKVEDNFLEDIGVDFRGLGQPGPGTNAFLNDFGDPTAQAIFGREIGTGTSLGAFYDRGWNGDVRGRVENLYDMTLGNEQMNGDGGLAFQWTYLNDLQSELVLRAVQKAERVELVTAPRLVVFNTARSNLSVLDQVAYVKDFDIEIAQAASIADPVIDIIQDGVVLDVRPVVSADRRFIMMELRPTVAILQRPIPEVQTSLGTQADVTIQLPDLEVQRVRTTVPMPDGSTVMLGGLKVSEKQDFVSTVPILDDIPIIRFLFQRKGIFNSNRKLLIMLRAQIVIPTELEPSPAQMGEY